MARIRTIKPEFFTSESILSVSPLARIFFIGLWCESDREGRLKWKPKTLKFRYLPADNVDIEDLALELESNDMIKTYSVSGVDYCQVTGFTTHQVVNNRERASDIPSIDADASTTRKPRVKAEGKEGKGKEGKGSSKDLSTEVDHVDSNESDHVIDKSDQALEVFTFWRDTMKKDPSRTRATAERMNKIKSRLKSYSVDDIKLAIVNCSLTPHNMGQNDRGKQFNDIELICRTDTHLEKFRDSNPVPQRNINSIGTDFSAPEDWQQ